MLRVDEPALLAREFAAFAAYLGAGGDVRRGAERYARSHASLPVSDATRLDHWLVAIARTGPLSASLADAYARVARPYGLLRRKIVLALAVLESSPSSHAKFDTALVSGPAFAWLALSALGMRWALRTILAVVLLGPVHLVAAFAPGERTRG